METVFFFKNMSETDQGIFRDYFSTKLHTVEKLVQHFSEDSVVLHVKCEKFDKHSAYDVELTLKLPSETIIAREASHLITKAVDLAKDRLTMQLKKFLTHIRRSHRSLRVKHKESTRIALPV